MVMALLWAALAAVCIASPVLAQDDEYGVPADYDPASTKVGFVTVTQTLPNLSEAGIAALASDVNLTLAWRTAVANSAGADVSPDPAYCILTSILWANGSVAADVNALATVNNYNGLPAADPSAPVARRMLLAAFARQLAGPDPAAGGDSGSGGEAGPGAPVVTTVYVYGKSFSYVNEAKFISGDYVFAQMSAALALPAAWEAVFAEPGAAALNVTADELAAAAAAPDAVAFTPPQLRYMPFGSLEPSTVGTAIGCGVFVIGIILVGLPSIIEHFQDKRAAAKAATAAADKQRLLGTKVTE